MTLHRQRAPRRGKRGRRPKGKGDPRQDILRAALRAFARRGYDAATMRGIARDAAVDPALVYHYFGDKRELFVEAMRLQMRRPTEDEMPRSAPPSRQAETVVRLFLERWGVGGEATPFLALLRSASTNREAATLLRHLFEEEITPHVAPSVEGGDVNLRVALIASTLLGLGLIRYIVRLEPAASARNEDMARWVAPVLIRYLKDPLT